MKVCNRRKHKHSKNLPEANVPSEFQLPPSNHIKYTENNRQHIDINQHQDRESLST